MDEQSAWKARVEDMDVRRKLKAEYQAAVNAFKAELDRIDLLNDTYAKIHYADSEVRVMHIHGMYTKPRSYNREIKLDEIVLEFVGPED